MANEEHLELINQGVDAWNKWRDAFGRKPLSIDEILAIPRPDLSGAYLFGKNLNKANLSDADLSGAYLFRANLSSANLYRASLSKAIFYEAKLRRANLNEASLISADFIRAEFREADLRAANLSEANLGSADLFRANLIEANVSGADLSETDLTGANLRGANLRGVRLIRANFSGTDLSGADLRGANLLGATLVETNLENANLTGCRIYGISAWNVRVNQETKQSNLIITHEDEPTIKVDDIQVAQFIHLLLKYENLRNVLNAVTKRGVLILGRFGGGGVEVLRELGEALRQSGYLPMIFEFARPEDRNYTETVRTLAGLARFVVVDLSGPSVPQELYATVPHLKIPFVPIVEKGRHPYSMFADLLEYEWMLNPIVEFDSPLALTHDLQDKIVSPAEKRIEMRQAKLKELFG